MQILDFRGRKQHRSAACAPQDKTAAVARLAAMAGPGEVKNLRGSEPVANLDQSSRGPLQQYKTSKPRGSVFGLPSGIRQRRQIVVSGDLRLADGQNALGGAH